MPKVAVKAIAGGDVQQAVDLPEYAVYQRRLIPFISVFHAPSELCQPYQNTLLGLAVNNQSCSQFIHRTSSPKPPSL